jgi:hypothetical protein
MKILLVMLLSFYSVFSYAQTQKLLTIHNDYDDNVNQFIAITDSLGNIKEFKIVKLAKNVTQSQRIISLAQLKAGAALVEKEGLSVISMRSMPSFDYRYGGAFEIRYLTNGVTKSYSSLHLDLIKDGNQWKVYSAKRAISLMKVETRSALGRTIGISRISF